MKSSFTSCILLLALVLSLNSGCAQKSSGKEPETTTNASSETTDAGESDREPYNIPELDFGSETFTILNPEKNYWDCYTTLDVEEETGEILDDAVFRRNVALEELFNFEFEIVEMEFGTDLPAELSNAIMAGDDVYDVAFTKPDQSFSVFTSGRLYNLYDLDALQLDKPWWDQYIVENLTVGDHLMLVSGPIQLMASELATTVYINKDMLIDAGMELPYDMVYNGTWTFDEMYKYATELSTIGTQSDWTYDPSGDAIYPIASHMGLCRNMFDGAGEMLISFDSGHMPVFDDPPQSFYDVAEIVAKCFDRTNNFMLDINMLNDSGYNKHSAFMNDRAVIYFLELQMTRYLRTMESDYCVVPCPKYSVEQEHYYSMTSWQSAMMCIPKTNVDAESAAAVLDYMAYLSLYDVWSNYLKKTIESKGTRDEESIDMINIIRDTITIDAGFVYSWTQDLFNQISDKMSAGDANIASVVASQKAAVEAKIDQFLEAIE